MPVPDRLQPIVEVGFTGDEEVKEATDSSRTSEERPMSCSFCNAVSFMSSHALFVPLRLTSGKRSAVR